MLKIIKKKHLKYKHQVLAIYFFLKENFHNEQYKNNIKCSKIFSYRKVSITYYKIRDAKNE